MPRKRRAQPATKAQRRRGLGVQIDELTSELNGQQQLLTELQSEHYQLRSTHDILVGYCDALAFGLELERARQNRSNRSCKENSVAAAAAAGSNDGVPWQGQQDSPAGSCGCAGVSEVEQQLLAQLAQLHYSAQPLGAPAQAAAGQQQQVCQQAKQQQQLHQVVEDEDACRNSSEQSSSSSTTTYHSSEAAVDDRICPPDDVFLLFRWLMAQPVSLEAEHVTPAELSAHYNKTVDHMSLLLLQLGEITPAQVPPPQQQRQMQPGSLQQLPLQLALQQQLQLTPAAQHQALQQQALQQQLQPVCSQSQLPPQFGEQQASQQQSNTQLQEPGMCHDRSEPHALQQQQDKQLQECTSEVLPLPLCTQLQLPTQPQPQQQRQQLVAELGRVMHCHIQLLLSLVRLGRGHVVSEMCMTNRHTGELMKECCLEHFKDGVRRSGLTKQQLQDITLAWNVFNSIHAPILQEVRQLQQQLGLAKLPASSSMLSHLTRCNNQSAQLDRLLLLQNKGSMLRNCFAYHVFGCMSWVQWARLSVLLVPYTPLAPVVAQAVAQVHAEEQMLAAELQRQQQQRMQQQQVQEQMRQQRLLASLDSD